MSYPKLLFNLLVLQKQYRSQLSLLPTIQSNNRKHKEYSRQNQRNWREKREIVERYALNWGTNYETQNRTEREFTDKFRKAQYEKKNRLRKSLSKVNRIFHCDIENCTKSYGSHGSLLQHQKIKHEEIYVQHHKERKKRITIVE